MFYMLYFMQSIFVLHKNVIMWVYYLIYFFIPILCSSHITVVVYGLNPELENNVYKQLSSIDFNIESINLDFQEQLNNAVKFGLKPLGYYHPTIEMIIDENNITKNNNHKLIIKINPGNPIKIIEVNIKIFGDGQYDDDYQQLIESSKIFIGKKLNHNDYEQLKNKIYNLAISKGYFDAKFNRSQLVVIPSLYQSIWNINFDSGKRYFFDEIKFKGSQIKSNYLNSICNISLGSYYDAKRIIELNKRLSSTNWFESIFTSPDFIMIDQKKN